MFITALFTITNIQKKPKCPLIDEYDGYIYTHPVEYCSEKEQKCAFSTMWIDLESIMLSEIRQRKTNTLCYHLHVEFKK